MWHHEFLETPEHLALKVSGNLDTAASAEFEAEFARLLGLDRDLVVDLTGLSYLNSTGIRSFLKVEKIVRSQGRTLRFIGANSRVIRIFSYCGLEDYFDLAPVQS